MADPTPVEIVVYRGRELPSRPIQFGDGARAWCNGTQCNVPADHCDIFESLPEIKPLLAKGIVKKESDSPAPAVQAHRPQPQHPGRQPATHKPEPSPAED